MKRGLLCRPSAKILMANPCGTVKRAEAASIGGKDKGCGDGVCSAVLVGVGFSGGTVWEGTRPGSGLNAVAVEGL